MKCVLKLNWYKSGYYFTAVDQTKRNEGFIVKTTVVSYLPLVVIAINSRNDPDHFFPNISPIATVRPSGAHINTLSSLRRQQQAFGGSETTKEDDDWNKNAQ